MKAAYDDYVIQNKNAKSFENWRTDREKEIPQFRYWSITLKLELLVLSFVRSILTGDFTLYKRSIKSLLPWFFALDHPHYARWLSVHLMDMIQLGQTNPGIENAFENGLFVINKTRKKFLSIGIDHAHEQNNKCVKGDGGKFLVYIKMTLIIQGLKVSSTR